MLNPIHISMIGDRCKHLKHAMVAGDGPHICQTCQINELSAKLKSYETDCNCRKLDDGTLWACNRCRLIKLQAKLSDSEATVAMITNLRDMIAVDLAAAEARERVLKEMVRTLESVIKNRGKS